MDFDPQGIEKDEGTIEMMMKNAAWRLRAACSLRARRAVAAFACLSMLMLAPVAPSYGQESGRAWSSSVTTGTYNTQAELENAIRLKPGYETVRSIKSVSMTDGSASYLYYRGFSDPDITNVFRNSTGAYPDEGSAASALKAYYDQSSSNSGCTPNTTVAPDGNWSTQAPAAGSRPYKVTYAIPPAGPSGCVRTNTYTHILRGATESCPAGMSLSSGKCVDNNTSSYVTVTAPPVPCSPCGPLGGPEKVHDPIDIALGEQVESELDSDLGWIRIERFYHSGVSSPSSGFGRGWSLSLFMRLALPSGGNTMYGLIRGDGTQVAFKSHDGAYVAVNGTGDRLTSISGGWTLHARDSIATFNASGHLVKTVDRGGRTLTYAYDSYQRVSSITDGSGRVLRISYGLGKQATDTPIAAISMNGEPVVLYGYSATGQLETATYPDVPIAQVRRYHYEDARFPNHLTGISDELEQRYLTVAYDAKGRSVLATKANGIDRGTVEYLPAGGVTSTDALGLVSTYTLTPSTGDGRPRFVGEISDANGAIRRAYNTIANDFRRRPSSVVSKDGSQTTFAYAQGVDSTSGIAVDLVTTRRAAGTPQEQVEEFSIARSNNAVVVHREANQRETRFNRNARAQVIGTVTKDLVSSVTRTTTATYCEQSDVTAGTCPLLGLVTKIDGPRTDVVDVATFTYYPSEDPACATSPSTCTHRRGDLWKVTNALGQVTETLRYDGAGRPLSVKDANGVVTDFEYHPRGWLTARKVRGADSGVETDDAITRIAYFPTGLVEKVTQPDGSFTTYTYDAAHRLTGIGDSLGNRIAYTLDNAGNRVKEDTFGSGDMLTRTLSRVYNQLGELITTKDAQGRTTSGFTYDATGNSDTVTDALGTVTNNDHDPLGRLTRTLQDVGGIQAETKFTYDALDQLTQVKDPKGLDTKYEYDGFGNLTKLTSPDTGVTTYTYDTAGNRKSRLDARSKATTYTYDALNRLKTVGYATTALNVTYTYDTVQAACVAGETFAVGRLTYMQDGSGATAYCYDRRGNMVRKVQTTNAKVFTVRYAHNLADQLVAVTYPSGTRVDYVRNANGQASGIKVTQQGSPEEVLLSSVSYYPFGPASEIRYGDGRLLKRSLTLDYLPGFIEDTMPGGLSLGYEFDTAGNLVTLRKADQADPPLRKYAYDRLGRLSSQRDPVTNTNYGTYWYDATGNRTRESSGNLLNRYTYDAGSHRLINREGVARTFDAVGSTTSIGGTAQQFTYDDTGRMDSVKRNGATAMNYAYTGKGEQVRRFPTGTSTAQTYAVYDEAGRALGVYDSTGTRVQEFIWLDDLPVGLTLGATAATNKLHQIEPDHLGTPRAIIDKVRQKAIWSWSLDGEAFGNTVPNQDPDADGAAFIFDLRFPGQRFDAASGLNYNINRDYLPGDGRYVQSDPIGLMGGLTTYSYVGSDPLLSFDPEGLTQVNLFSPYSGKDDNLLRIADSYWDRPGKCLVYAHGGPDVVIDGRGKKSVRITSGKQLEKLLLNSGCKPKQPVILYSCNTGRGKNSIAEQLSRTESFPDVRAPTRQIWYNQPWFWSSGPDRIFGKMPDGKTINYGDPGMMVDY